MKRLLHLSALLLSLANCTSKDNGGSAVDIEETAQQIGDVMASIDESGGSTSGTYAYSSMQSEQKMFARVLPNQSKPTLSEMIFPQAQAAACGFGGFSSCANNEIIRTFNNCTIGTATLSGTVTLDWTDSGVDNTCAMTSNGHTIARDPDFTLTGRRGGTMTVEKTATFGQKITRVGFGLFEFTNDGIRRVIEYNGNTIYDFTTTVQGGALDIQGQSRSGRVLSSSGATLRVTNNANSEYCDYTPQAVTWTAGCTCATSGLWTSTCSDGSSSSLEITECGKGTFTMGDESQTVTFDRCTGI